MGKVTAIGGTWQHAMNFTCCRCGTRQARVLQCVLCGQNRSDSRGAPSGWRSTHNWRLQPELQCSSPGREHTGSWWFLRGPCGA